MQIIRFGGLVTGLRSLNRAQSAKFPLVSHLIWKFDAETRSILTASATTQSYAAGFPHLAKRPPELPASPFSADRYGRSAVG